jgi:hypothetical protein
MTCKHETIQTFRTVDGEPIMWACLNCRMKFVPMTQLLDEVRSERARMNDLIERVSARLSERGSELLVREVFIDRVHETRR